MSQTDSNEVYIQEYKQTSTEVKLRGILYKQTLGPDIN